MRQTTINNMGDFMSSIPNKIKKGFLKLHDHYLKVLVISLHLDFDMKGRNKCIIKERDKGM